VLTTASPVINAAQRLTFVFCSSLLVLLSFRTTGNAQDINPQQQMVDRIIAVVAKEPIMLSDLNSEIEFYVLNNHLDPNTPGLQKQVLDKMIDQKLILARAQDDTNITVTDDEVTNQLEGVLQQRIQQAGSEKALEDAYGMSMTKIRREFRDEMRKQVYIQKLQQSKLGEVTVSRREVEDFYYQYKDSLPKVPDEVELYHIYKTPLVSNDARKAVIAKARLIIDSIKHGGDFASFAKRYSDDLGSAQGGGDLNFVRRGEFVHDFEEAAYALGDSEISAPVESPFGIHIIQMLERRGESIHTRHILLKIPEDSTSKTRTIDLLLSLRDSALAGASFFDLAKRYSDDKETSPNGGLIGKFPMSQLEKSLADTIKNMKVGDISMPIEVASGSSKGYHIIYVTEKTPEHIMNLKDDWARLEQLAVKFKQNTEYVKWVQQLRDEIYWDSRL
jgi:peptidyl-prolyl cis-trans isomerase SurA